MDRKYIKPRSVTWWASFVPFAAGVFMAAEPVHGMAEIVVSIENGTNMTAFELIQLGLLGIGVRGAFDGMAR